MKKASEGDLFRESRARANFWTEPRIVDALSSPSPAGQQAEPSVRQLPRREAACRRGPLADPEPWTPSSERSRSESR
eukprot:7362228-Prymnesium_polylepis.1